MKTFIYNITYVLLSSLRLSGFEPCKRSLGGSFVGCRRITSGLWSVHKQSLCRAASCCRTDQTHWCRHRPGLDRHDLSPDREVLSNVDGSVDHMIPHGRVVSAIHDVYLDLHGSRQKRVPFVLSHGLQLVRFSLARATQMEHTITVLDCRRLAKYTVKNQSQ